MLDVELSTDDQLTDEKKRIVNYLEVDHFIKSIKAVTYLLEVEKELNKRNLN